MIRVFVGYDLRQPLGYNVLQHSIQRYASERVSIEPLKLDRLPIKRRGLTEFTFSRFLVPWLCDYQGTAIFMDADIVVKGNIAELAKLADGAASVQVMQEQPRFEWASVMLFNNEHCKILTPEYVDDIRNPLLDLTWGYPGRLPKEWNHCVGYQDPAPAKLYHYTQGLPCWRETEDLEPEPWVEEFRDMQRTASWNELMGGSVHAQPVLSRVMAKYGIALKVA